MDLNMIFRIAMLLQFVGYLVPRSYFRMKARRARGETHLLSSQLSESKWRLVLMGLSGLGAHLVGFLWLINPDWLAWSNLDLPTWLRWLGVGIAVLTVVMSYFVHRTLGPNFTPTLQTTETHFIVQEGIYAYIRHPMYTTFFLLFISSFLISTNYLIAVSGLVYSLLIINRVNAEETMMLETFGDPYRAYMAQTGRFTPKWIKQPAES